MAVDLEVSGARAETAGYGVKLTLAATGRELAYSRLHVTDAAGRELTARLEVPAADRLLVRVVDAGAVYPVRIDPTFSDADWVSLNPSIPGVNGVVLALAAGGNGNLFVGGVFTRIGTVAANSIARWDGSSWSALGSGIDGGVRALAVIGNDLYAGGAFTTAGDLTVNRIVKWDGSAWSALGTGMNSSVWALAASGSDLYAGGAFTTAGGVPANRIAKWDGSEWSPLGAGMDTTVLALAVNGSELYAGGSFTSAGGNDVNSIAKWDGATWSALGTGMSSMVSATVKALAVMGSDLYAGGSFSTAGGTVAGNIAKWDGVGWSALGSGMNGSVDALAVSGTVLYAGGNFTIAGGTSAKGVAKWGGGTWSALGTGTSLVNALAVVGRDLYAGGSFVNPGGGIVRRIAKWDGVGWSALGMGTDNTVWALAADSSGHLFVGGDFLNAGPNISAFIAQANLPLTALESWRRAHFGIIGNSGDAADIFDFEKDGLVNLIEWACGLNPTLASALPASVVRDGAVLEFTHQRSVAALNAGAVFAVEWNDAPVFTGWSTAGVSEMVMSDDGILQQVKATLPAGTLGYRFVHLKVTAPAE